MPSVENKEDVAFKSCLKLLLKDNDLKTEADLVDGICSFLLSIRNEKNRSLATIKVTQGSKIAFLVLAANKFHDHVLDEKTAKHSHFHSYYDDLIYLILDHLGDANNMEVMWMCNILRTFLHGCGGLDDNDVSQLRYNVKNIEKVDTWPKFTPPQTGASLTGLVTSEREKATDLCESLNALMSKVAVKEQTTQSSPITFADGVDEKEMFHMKEFCRRSFERHRGQEKVFRLIDNLPLLTDCLPRSPQLLTTGVITFPTAPENAVVMQMRLSQFLQDLEAVTAVLSVQHFDTLQTKQFQALCRVICAGVAFVMQTLCSDKLKKTEGSVGATGSPAVVGKPSTSKVDESLKSINYVTQHLVKIIESTHTLIHSGARSPLWYEQTLEFLISRTIMHGASYLRQMGRPPLRTSAVTGPCVTHLLATALDSWQRLLVRIHHDWERRPEGSPTEENVPEEGSFSLDTAMEWTPTGLVRILMEPLDSMVLDWLQFVHCNVKKALQSDSYESAKSKTSNSHESSPAEENKDEGRSVDVDDPECGSLGLDILFNETEANKRTIRGSGEAFMEAMGLVSLGRRPGDTGSQFEVSVTMDFINRESVKEPRYLELAVKLVTTLDRLVQSPVEFVITNLRSQFGEQCVATLSSLIKDLDADKTTWSEDSDFHEFNGRLAALVHHLLLHYVINEEQQLKILDQLGISPTASAPPWPLCVPGRSLSFLANVVIVWVTQSGSGSTEDKNRVDATICAVWTRMMESLERQIVTPSSSLEMLDINPEHMQLLVFIFDCLSSLTARKTIFCLLMDVLVKVAVVCGNESPTNSAETLSRRLLVARLLLLVKYMLCYFYVPTDELPDQVRHNLFSRWLPPSAVTVTSSANTKTTAMERVSGLAVYLYPELKEATIRLPGSAFANSTSPVLFYDMSPVADVAVNPKEERLAISVLVTKPNYEEVFSSLLQIMSQCLAPSWPDNTEEDTMATRARLTLNNYLFLVSWPVFSTVPPPASFIEALTRRELKSDPAHGLFFLAQAAKFFNEKTAQTLGELLSRSPSATQLTQTPEELMELCTKEVYIVPRVVELVLLQGVDLSRALGGLTPLEKYAPERAREILMSRALEPERLVMMDSLLDYLGRVMVEGLNAETTDVTNTRLTQSSLVLGSLEDVVNSANSIFNFAYDLLDKLCTLARYIVLTNAADLWETADASRQEAGWFHLLGLWPSRLASVAGCQKLSANLQVNHVPKRLQEALADWSYGLDKFPDRTERFTHLLTVLRTVHLTHLHEAQQSGPNPTRSQLQFGILKRLICTADHLTNQLASWASQANQEAARPILMRLYMDGLLERAGGEVTTALESVLGRGITTEETRSVIECHVIRSMVQLIVGGGQGSAPLDDVQRECLAFLETSLDRSSGRTALTEVLGQDRLMVRLFLSLADPWRSTTYRIGVFKFCITVFFRASKSGSSQPLYSQLAGCLGGLSESDTEHLSAWILTLLGRVGETGPEAALMQELRMKLDQFSRLVVGDWTTDTKLRSSVCHALLKALLTINPVIVDCANRMMSEVEGETSLASTQLVGLPDLACTMCSLAGGCEGASGHNDLVQNVLEWTQLLQKCLIFENKSSALKESMTVLLETLQCLFSYLSTLVCALNPDYSVTNGSFASPFLYAGAAAALYGEPTGETGPAGPLNFPSNELSKEVESEEDSDSESLNDKLCTFSATQKDYVEQHWYNCHTCGMQDIEGVCSVCAKVCHLGHDLTYAKKGGFFCDCGAKGFPACSAMLRRLNYAPPGSPAVQWSAVERPTPSMSGSSSKTSGGTTLRRKMGVMGRSAQGLRSAAMNVSRRLEAAGERSKRRTVRGGSKGTSEEPDPMPVDGVPGGHREGPWEGAAGPCYLEEMRKKIGEDRETLSILLETSPLLENIIELLGRLEPLLSQQYQSMATGGLARMQTAFTKMHMENKTTEKTTKIVTSIVNTQEGAFDCARLQSSSGSSTGGTETSMQLRQLLQNNQLRRVGMAVLSFTPTESTGGLGIAQTTRRRHYLAVAHEKAKFSMLPLSNLLKQVNADAGRLFASSATPGETEAKTVSGTPKPRLTMSKVSTTNTGFQVVTIASNPANEDLLAVCGTKDCAVYTVTAMGSISSKVSVSPVIDNNDYILRPVWLPGSRSQLALVTAHSVQVFDVASDTNTPLYHFITVEGKFKDATFVMSCERGQEEVCFILVMAQSGCILWEKLGPNCLASKGTFYLAETFEWIEGDELVHRDTATGSVGYGGASLFYSHSLQMMVHSYQCGKSFFTSLDPKTCTAKKTFPVDLKSINACIGGNPTGAANKSGAGNPSPLVNFSEVVGHPGLLSAVSQSTNTVVLIGIEPSRVMVHEVKATTVTPPTPRTANNGAAARTKMMDTVTLRTGGATGRTVTIMLTEDGGLSVQAAKTLEEMMSSEAAGDNEVWDGHFWLQPAFQSYSPLLTSSLPTPRPVLEQKVTSSKQGGRIKDRTLVESPADGPIPVDFFEHCKHSNEVIFGGADLLQIYNTDQLKRRLSTADMPVACARPAGFTLVITPRPDSDLVIVGVRVGLSATESERVPASITVFDRRHDVGRISKTRPFDIPFYRSEILSSEEKQITFGRSTDPHHITMVDWVYVYTRTKESVGWPTDKGRTDVPDKGADLADNALAGETVPQLRSPALLTVHLPPQRTDECATGRVLLLPGASFTAAALELTTSIVHYLDADQNLHMSGPLTEARREVLLARSRALMTSPAPPPVAHGAAALLSVLHAADLRSYLTRCQMDRVIRQMGPETEEGEEKESVPLDPAVFHEALAVVRRVVSSHVGPSGSPADLLSVAQPSPQCFVQRLVDMLVALIDAQPDNPWISPLDQACVRNLGQIVSEVVEVLHGFLLAELSVCGVSAAEYLADPVSTPISKLMNRILDAYVRLLLHKHPLVSQSCRDTITRLMQPSPPAAEKAPAPSKKASDSKKSSSSAPIKRKSTDSEAQRTRRHRPLPVEPSVVDPEPVPPHLHDYMPSPRSVQEARRRRQQVHLEEFMPPGIDIEDEDEEDDDDEDDDEDEDEEDVGGIADEAAMLLESLQAGNPESNEMMQAILEQVNDQDLLSIALHLSMQDQGGPGSSPAPPAPTGSGGGSVSGSPAPRPSSSTAASSVAASSGPQQANNQAVDNGGENQAGPEDSDDDDEEEEEGEEEGEWVEGVSEPAHPDAPVTDQATTKQHSRSGSSDSGSSGGIADLAASCPGKQEVGRSSQKTTTSKSETSSEHQLHEVRVILLARLASSWGELEVVDGVRTVPYLQVVYHLIRDLDLVNSAQDRLALDLVVKRCLMFLSVETRSAESMVERSPNSESTLVHLRLLTHFLSRTSPAETGAVTTTASSSVLHKNYMAQITLSALLASGCADFCLRVIQVLHNLWKNSNLDEEPSENMIRPAPLYPYTDMTPFFLRQYVREHQHDLFASYLPLVTEVVLRVPYMMLKTMAGADAAGPSTGKSRRHVDLGPFKEERWGRVLCEFVEMVESSFLKKQIKRLLMLVVGSRHYRQLRDIHLIGRTMQGIRSVCAKNKLEVTPLLAHTGEQAEEMADAEVQRSINIPYLTLCDLVESVKVCSEVANTRTANWQRYCLSAPDVLVFLFRAVIAIDSFVAEQLLQLLQRALCQRTEEKEADKDKAKEKVTASKTKAPTEEKKEKSKKEKSSKKKTTDAEGGLEAKLCQSLSRILSKKVLLQFIRLFVCRALASETRWIAENIVHALCKHADPQFQRSVLDLLWSLWSEMPGYAPKATQYLDLLGHLLITPAAIGGDRPAGILEAIVNTVYQQNALLTAHPNALLYTAIQKWVDCEGFYLESEPCQVCHEKPLPFTTVKWDSEPLDSKRPQTLPKGYIEPHARSTVSTHVFKFKNSYVISSVHIKFNLVTKRQRFVRTLNLYYSNLDVKTPVRMRSRPDLWNKAKRVSITKEQTEVTIDLPVPITACYLIVEYADFYPPPAGEKVQCPRCHVPVEGGTCPHCKDNVNQCFKCRCINLSQRDAYLCTYCNSCRYGKIEFSMSVRPTCVVEGIQSEEDRATMLTQMSRSMESLDKKARALAQLRIKMETLLSRLVERDAAESQILNAALGNFGGEAQEEARKLGVAQQQAAIQQLWQQSTASGGPPALTAAQSQALVTQSLHKDLQNLALRYLGEGRPLFLEFNNLALQVLTTRRAVVEYDRRLETLTQQLAAEDNAVCPESQAQPLFRLSSSEMALCASGRGLDAGAAASAVHPLREDSAPVCYGCSYTTLRRSVWLLRGLFGVQEYREAMTGSGFLMELVERCLRLGGSTLRREVRHLVCAFTRNQPEQVRELNKLVESRIAGLLSSQADNPDLEWILRQEMELLKASAALRDACWEERLRPVLRLLQRHRTQSSPAVVKAVLLPCFRLLQSSLRAGIMVATSRAAPPRTGPPPPETTEVPLASYVRLTPDQISVDLAAWMEGVPRSDFKSWLENNPKSGNRRIARRQPTSQLSRVKETPSPEAIHARTLEEKYYWRWMDNVHARRRARETPSATRGVALSTRSWVREALFTPVSASCRQCASSLLESICQGCPERQSLVLGFLVECLPDLETAGEEGADFMALLKKLSGADPWRFYLVIKLNLLDRMHHITMDCLRALARMETECSQVQPGRCQLLQWMGDLVYFLAEKGEISTHYRTHLIRYLLHSYLNVKRLVLQRNRITAETEKRFLDLIDQLSSGSDEHIRDFMRIALEVVAQYPITDYDSATFIFDRLGAIIKPADYQHPSFSIVLETFKGQEEYLFGRMTGVPIRSDTPGIGPRIRDVRTFICEENGFDSFFSESDSGLQVLVGNNVLSPSLLLEDVYQQIWSRTASNQNHPMKLIYRIGGMDDDPDEQHIEALSKVVLKTEAEVENYYRMSDVMAEDGGLGLRVVLNRLASVRELVLGRPLMEICMRLLDYCLKKKVNRERIVDPTLRAIPILVHAAEVCLRGAGMEDSLHVCHELAAPILDMLRLVLQEAGKAPPEALRQFALQTGDVEHIQSLLNLVRGNRHLEIYQIGVSKCLALLAFGVEDKINAIIDFFQPVINFIKFDTQFSETEKDLMVCFCSLTAGIPNDEQGARMKDALLARGIVQSCIDYLRTTAPDLEEGEIKLDSDTVNLFLRQASLPLVLQVMRGSCGYHPAGGEAVEKAGLIPLLHKLETVTAVKGIGSLAEDLCDDLLSCGPAVAGPLDKLRKKTRDEKRKRAMAMRQKQLNKLNMEANAKGQVKLKESAAAKLEYLKDEAGLVCSVCREGYRYQPTKSMAIYTFTKRCPLEEFEAGDAKTMGYCTVSNFTVIHHACHAQALQNSREGEWKVARRHNGDVKCNGFLPLYGPQIQEGVFVSNLAKHNSYIMDHIGFRDISYTTGVHDLKLLLVRFAHNRSFSDEAEGGGRESNMQLAPYLLFVSLQTMNATQSLTREKEALATFVAVPASESQRWVESSWEPAGPLFRCVLALLVWSREEWCTHRIIFLRRLVVLAHTRSTLSRGAKELTVKEPREYEVYKPYLIFFALVDGFYHRLFKRVKLVLESGKESSDPPTPTPDPPREEGRQVSWSEALAHYIRNNDVALQEDVKELLRFYEADLLPCLSLGEFCDVAGLLNDIPNVETFIPDCINFVQP